MQVSVRVGAAYRYTVLYGMRLFTRLVFIATSVPVSSFYHHALSAVGRNNRSSARKYPSLLGEAIFSIYRVRRLRALPKPWGNDSK